MKPVVQKSLMWAVLLSETSHVFCCVLPTLFSILGLLAGLGMVAVMPASMVRIHELIHQWEIPMILASAAILVFGWAVTLYSDRIDCHSTGCGHGACAPRKTKAHLVLKIATVLFLLNVLIYAGLHRSNWVASQIAPSAPREEHAGH